MKPAAAAAAGVFAAQFAARLGSSIVSGVQAIGQGAASLAALLPAAALAGVAAFGTLKLAVLGVGDALSAGLSGDVAAFDEALKGLSPSARAFAREVVGMKAAVDRLRATVQDRFFAEFAGQVAPLGAALLPAVERTLGGIARAFGVVVSGS